MARSQQPRNRQPRSPKPNANRAASTPPDVLDPALPKEIAGLTSGFFKRIGLLFVFVAIMAEMVIHFAKIPNQSAPLVFAFSLFGIIIPLVRGVERVFHCIRDIGRDRLERRRYVDAIYALDYFHRFGTMSFDASGEAHYLLVRAYMGIGSSEKASQMLVWLQRSRRKSAWTRKAEEAMGVLVS